jgi:addiction module RelE/StbE family toxin
MQLEYAERFIKKLRKSPKQIQKSVRIRLELFTADRFHPLLNDHALAGKLRGYRSINITGDWRALYIEVKVGVAYFEDLGTHSQLYK